MPSPRIQSRAEHLPLIATKIRNSPHITKSSKDAMNCVSTAIDIKHRRNELRPNNKNMAKAFQDKLRKIQVRLPQAIKRLPGIVKTEGLRFIADNFKHQGFEVKKGQYKKWKKKKEGNKPTLIGEKRGGGMRRSWKGSSTQAQAEFSSAKPYTEVHNDGLMAGKPPGFKMPQRQMIGDSEALHGRVENKLDGLAKEVFL